MKPSSPVISAVVFGLAVFMLLLFGLGSLDPSDAEEAPSFPGREVLAMSEGDELSAGLPVLRSRSEEPTKAPADVIPVALRTSARAALSGLIADQDGLAIADADVLWTSLSDAVEELSVSTRADGRFSFEFAPRELRSSWSAVWILHPAYYAELVVLSPGEDPSSAFRGMRRLEKAPTFSASVKRESGEAVKDAEVVQTLVVSSIPPTTRISEGGDSMRARALRSFKSSSRTDSNGEALLVPMRMGSTLTASAEAGRSAPWTGQSVGEVDLMIRSTFIALGVVSGSFGPGTQVHCEGVAFGEVTHFAEHLVDETGAWGPAQLPLLEVDEYVFTLRGDVAASQVRVPRSEVVDRLIVNLEGVHGVGVPLLVLGPDEAPLEGASTTVHWKQDGSWQSVAASSDEAGVARARGVPEGNSYARIHHTGHVSQMIGPFEVAEGMETLEVHLELAGLITGRCLRDGEPVQDFQVLYWSEDPRQVAREEVKGSEDGSFFIKEAPLGEVTLVGLDTQVANGSPQTVLVASGEIAEVMIELPRPLSATGEVVDAVTGDPVVGARLQVMSSFEGRGLAEFGAEEATDHGGGFQLEGLACGAGTLRVCADEYIDEYVITHGRVGEELELGLIALQPSRELLVQLDGPEGTSYVGYKVGLVGFEHLGVLEANHRGAVKFQDIPNGVIQLNIYHPDSSITAFADSLNPEDDGHILVPVSTGNRLYVRVLPQPGSELPEDLFVGVGGMRADGSEVVHWLREEGDGRFLLESAKPGPTVARAVALSGEVYAMRRFDLSDAEETEIQLELGEEDDFVIKVLDSEELPVHNAMVSIYLPRTDPCFFVRNLVTGSSGEVRIRGFGFSHAQVTVSHETKGSGDVGYVDVEALGAEPLIVRLESSARLDILVHDGGDPIAAAAATLYAVEPLLNGSGFGDRTTAQDGSATWESLMPGGFELSIHGVGLWPTRRRIEVDTTGHRQVLEVRRTGHLSFLLFNDRGHAVAGAEVELHCAELDASVSDWIASGRLQGATTLTDASGRLSLPPLPHGSWTWSATTADGRTGAGAVVLPAGELVEVVSALQ